MFFDLLLFETAKSDDLNLIKGQTPRKSRSVGGFLPSLSEVPSLARGVRTASSRACREVRSVEFARLLSGCVWYLGTRVRD